jgi:hypothetical protein
MVEWARRQADTGVRFATGDALWKAADAAFPGVLPADAKQLSRDWPLARDLRHAYIRGLPAVEAGDPVQLRGTETHTARRATVTAVHGPSLLRVRLDAVPNEPGGTVVDVSRLHVEAIPRIFYTATIITLDGSDTAADSAACEPGHGYTERSGWWDPDRAYWRVGDDRGDVSADVFPDGDGRDPVRWLADQLTARLARVDGYDAGRAFSGAYEAVHPGRLSDHATDPTAPNPNWGQTVAAIRMRLACAGQRTLSAAGHAHGFTDSQLAGAARLLGLT